MAITKTLGGDRLGSGNKQKVEMHGYERSTHDLGYLWRSTMSPGTLVPFMKKVALPGDTFDINLDCFINTHPTIGPLFGSYKVQLDVFSAPLRLYMSALHNNKLGIGLDMAQVQLPQIGLTATRETNQNIDLDNSQVNPSCLLAYLGYRGFGLLTAADTQKVRVFNGLAILAYWDIYKQYYSNKMEEIGAVIHAPSPQTPVTTIDEFEVTTTPNPSIELPTAPAIQPIVFNQSTTAVITYTTATPFIPDTIILTTNSGINYKLSDLFYNWEDNLSDRITFTNYKWAQFGDLTFINWHYQTASDVPITEPQVVTFPLTNIDEARETILAQPPLVALYMNTDLDLEPYNYLYDPSNVRWSQEGLGIKTYQSDLFNNWLRTEYIDNINAVSAVDTSGNEFTIDALQLAKKVYDMLNRIAVSGGTYDDWLDVVYTEERAQRAESPIYHGGYTRELVFQEVISNANAETGDGTQPLGTLAGKGTLSNKSKGGNIVVKVTEPSLIIGIVSLTPRLDYSQGNDWDNLLLTMNDYHKPALDEIGFQDLQCEQMAWWSTSQDVDAGPWVTRSAGKQPAWINYMTDTNKVYGNFAIKDNEMFMVLTRKYELDPGSGQGIGDLTTYIDPVKFNNIFAQTSLDAQNFWTQIAVDITARRKMSAKVMPNL